MAAYSQDMILLKRNMRNIRLILSAKQKSINQFNLTIYPNMTSTATTVSIFLLLIMDIWEMLRTLPEEVSSVNTTELRKDSVIPNLLLLTTSTFTRRLYLSISKMNQRRGNLRARRMRKKRMTGQSYRSGHMLLLKLMKSLTQLLMSIPCTRLTNKILTSGILKQRVLHCTIVSKSTIHKKRAHIHIGRRTCMRGLRK